MSRDASLKKRDLFFMKYKTQFVVLCIKHDFMAYLLAADFASCLDSVLEKKY